MKLVSFRFEGQDKYGVVLDGGVVDVSARLGGKYPDLRAVVEADALHELRRLAEREEPDMAIGDIEFLLPIPRPDKVLCVGRNYDEYHEVVLDQKRPQWPSIFPRFANSFAAHEEPLLRPTLSEQLDYEAELALVVGKTGRHIPEDRVFDHILGYTICNEGSVRDWQEKGSQNCPGKNYYHSGAFGPWIVTADEIADPNGLAIQTKVNGERRQDGNTGSMIFKIPFLVHHISDFTQLEPGDVIATGSPGGTAISLPHKPWLKPKDRIEMTIRSVGTLANPVIAE